MSKDWLLEEVTSDGGTEPPTEFEPLNNSAALFQTFAELGNSDRDAMLGFANKYGWLGFHARRPNETLAYGYTSHEADTGPRGVLRESYSSWNLAVAWMKWAVRVKDAIKSGNLSELRPHFVNGCFISHLGKDFDSVGPADGPQFYSAWGDLAIEPGGQGDFVPAARFLERWVNVHLVQYSAAGLAYDPAKRAFRIHIVPTNLIGAMWFQLARSVAENRDYRQCLQCGGWYEVSSSADARTARREYCDTNCKVRAFRRRRERVLILAAEGKTLRQVMKALQAEGLTMNQAKVREWMRSGR